MAWCTEGSRRQEQAERARKPRQKEEKGGRRREKRETANDTCTPTSRQRGEGTSWESAATSLPIRPGRRSATGRGTCRQPKGKRRSKKQKEQQKAASTEGQAHGRGKHLPRAGVRGRGGEEAEKATSKGDGTQAVGWRRKRETAVWAAEGRWRPCLEQSHEVNGELERVPMGKA